MAPARVELQRRPFAPSRFTRTDGSRRPAERQQSGHVVGVRRAPCRIAPRVAKLELTERTLVVGECRKRLQRIRRTARATRTRAAEHEPPYACGVTERELLRHHAAEGHADDPRVAPADCVEERSRIVGVVGHRVGAGRHVRAAESALIVCEHLEALGERGVEHAGTQAQVAAGTAHEQHAFTGTDALVVELDAADAGERHVQALSATRS